METLTNLESFVLRRLALTPAALSGNVAMLERNLGVRLFHRSTRKLTLAEPGASPDYMERRTPSADPAQLSEFDGIVMRSVRTGRVVQRVMRNAWGRRCRQCNPKELC
jgi:hypothetical protein